MDEGLRSPLLDHDPGEPPVFRPGNLLEAARRRKRLPRMKALRDEGTSYHYLPAGRFSIASPSLMAVVARRMAEAEIPVHRGTSWTTDAPFREQVGGEILACGTCLKLRNSQGSEPCPLSAMKDLRALIREVDRVVTF